MVILFMATDGTDLHRCVLKSRTCGYVAMKNQGTGVRRKGRCHENLPAGQKKAPAIHAGAHYDQAIALFSNHFKINFNSVSVAEVDRGFVYAQFFYFIHNRNTFAVDLVTFLVADRACDL